MTHYPRNHVRPPFTLRDLMISSDDAQSAFATVYSMHALGPVCNFLLAQGLLHPFDMKFTAVSSLLLLPLTAQALPTFSWGKQAKDIPELSLAEWESIHNPVGGAAAYAYSKAAEWVGNTEAEDSELTVWQLLNKDPERYSKITKLIGLIPPAKAVLDDRAGSLTFFAPENDGIPEPHHPHDGHGGHHGGHHDHDDDDDEDAAIENLAANPSIANLYQHHVKTGDGHHHHDDDEKKRHRKEAFKFILSQVLAYHTLDSPKSAVDLAKNNTIA